MILYLDSQKTYRVFENLLVNITKYAMPRTGCMWIWRMTRNGTHFYEEYLSLRADLQPVGDHRTVRPG